MAGRIDKAECRQLRAEGWKLDQLAARYGVRRAAVCKACKGIVCPVDYSLNGVQALAAQRAASRDEKQSRARAMFEAGHGPKEIAYAIGCSVSSAFLYLKGLRQPRAPRGRRSVQVPGWVPAPLRETY